jgi:hypothetical protein
MATQDVLDAYNAAWGEPDAGVRRGLLEKAWADDAVYTDPMTVAAGREALVDWIGVMHEQFPGCAIQQTGTLEEHHGTVHFTWDFVVLAPDGRIQSITGFYPPPGS